MMIVNLNSTCLKFAKNFTFSDCWDKLNSKDNDLKGRIQVVYVNIISYVDNNLKIPYKYMY